jgi:hypothetical protein
MICGVCEGWERGECGGYLRKRNGAKGWTHLTQLAHLLAKTANTCEGSTTWVFEAHFVYHGVYFSWEDAHDSEGGHVEAHACPGLQFVCGKCGSVGDDVAWSRRSFHYD